MGLLSRNFRDFSREGDGPRTIRCWKFLLLHFKADGRVKYAIEAFNLLSQVKGILPPLQAHQLVWNRVCNTRGGQGCNIPLDLHVEHLNRVFKDNINTFRVNISERNISRSSKAISLSKELLEKFDCQTGVKQPSGEHIEPHLQEDFKLVVDTLLSEKVLCRSLGRRHLSFKNIEVILSFA